MTYSPKRRNWVRAAFALKILKEGLEEFVDNEITNLQTSYLNDIRTSCGLANDATCNQCTIENVLPCPTSGTCRLQRGGICVFHNGPTKYPRMCPSQICDKIARKIVNEHRYTPASGFVLNYAAPSWKNTDTSKWCFNACEIAKCFVTESGYADKSSVSELDCPGILSIVINGGFMQKALSEKIDPPKDIFCKNRTARNAIMHSSSLEVTDDELQLYIDDMITLLNDDLKLKNHPGAEIARDKLNQVKIDIVVISSRDEIELRKEALAAIAEKKSEALDELNAKISEGLGKISTYIQTGADSITQQEHDSTRKLEADYKNHADKIKDELNKCVAKVGMLSTNAETSIDTKLKAVHTSLQQTLCTLNNADSKYQQTQLQMTIEVEKLSEAQKKTQNDVQDLYYQIGEIIKDMKKYHQTVTDLQTWCGVDKQKDCIERLQNQADLQSSLCEMYTKHLSTIPVSPLQGKLQMNINTAYTDLVIKDDKVYDTKFKKRKSGRQRNAFTLKTYRDIFRHNDGTICQNIFVIGDVGMGKTTWCLKLLNIWISSVVEISKTISTVMDENMSFIGIYKYVFYIPLRQMKSSYTVLDMIQSYLFQNEPEKMSTCRYVLEHEPEKCLVILDGLDEWSLRKNQDISINHKGIPGRHQNSTFSVVTTTRTWKFESLRLSPPDIDRAVKICGLDEIGMSRLANCVINHLNEVNNTDKSYFRIGLLNQFSFHRIFSILRVPLLLTAVVCLWYEDFGRLDRSNAGMYATLVEVLIQYAEGDKLKIRQHLDISKLSFVENVAVLKEKWLNIRVTLPMCFQNDVCESYGPLLLHIGRLAYAGIFTNTILTQDTVEKYLSDDEISLALAIGILSQSQIRESVVEKEKVGTVFFNISLQEFFAAIYITYMEEHAKSEFTKFVQICARCDIDSYNTLIFLSGMSSNILEDITRRIYDEGMGDIFSVFKFKVMLRQLNVKQISKRHLKMLLAELEIKFKPLSSLLVNQ